MLVIDLTIFVPNVPYILVFQYANKIENSFRKWPWQILGYLWKFISPCFIIFIMVYYVGAWTGVVVPRTRTGTFRHGRLTSETALNRNIIWFLSIFNLGWARWICNGIFKEMFRKNERFQTVKNLGPKFWTHKKYDMDSWLFYCKINEKSWLFNIWGSFMNSSTFQNLKPDDSNWLHFTPIDPNWPWVIRIF